VTDVFLDNIRYQHRKDAMRKNISEISDSDRTAPIQPRFQEISDIYNEIRDTVTQSREMRSFWQAPGGAVFIVNADEVARDDRLIITAAISLGINLMDIYEAHSNAMVLYYSCHPRVVQHRDDHLVVNLIGQLVCDSSPARARLGYPRGPNQSHDFTYQQLEDYFFYLLQEFREARPLVVIVDSVNYLFRHGAHNRRRARDILHRPMDAVQNDVYDHPLKVAITAADQYDPEGVVNGNIFTYTVTENVKRAARDAVAATAQRARRAEQTEQWAEQQIGITGRAPSSFGGSAYVSEHGSGYVPPLIPLTRRLQPPSSTDSSGQRGRG
jgi:hypothetical protein